MRQAELDQYLPYELPSLASLREANAAAVCIERADGGPLIVTYVRGRAARCRGTSSRTRRAGRRAHALPLPFPRAPHYRPACTRCAPPAEPAQDGESEEGADARQVPRKRAARPLTPPPPATPREQDNNLTPRGKCRSGGGTFFSS